MRAVEYRPWIRKKIRGLGQICMLLKASQMVVETVEVNLFLHDSCRLTQWQEYTAQACPTEARTDIHRSKLVCSCGR